MRQNGAARGCEASSREQSSRHGAWQRCNGHAISVRSRLQSSPASARRDVICWPLQLDKGRRRRGGDWQLAWHKAERQRVAWHSGKILAEPRNPGRPLNGFISPSPPRTFPLRFSAEPWGSQSCRRHQKGVYKVLRRCARGSAAPRPPAARRAASIGSLHPF